MAEVLRYVNTASTPGGDGTTNATSGANRAYASLSEWESNEQTDLVTDGDTHRVVCEGATADSTALTLDGWTTGASNDITIETDADDANGRHEGTWSTSHYRIVLSNDWTNIVNILENYVSFIGIQYENTSASGSGNLRYGATGNGALTVSHCICKNSVSTALGGIALDQVSGTINYKIYNNVIYDAGVGINIKSGQDDDGFIANNTIVDCTTGIKGVGYNYGGLSFYNNICNGNTTDYDLTQSSPTTSNNISEDTTSPDTSYRSKAVTFNDESGDDFSLGAADTNAKDAGTDRSADFTDDILGTTRSGTWDIGAFEYVSGVTASPTGTIYGPLFGPLGGPV